MRIPAPLPSLAAVVSSLALVAAAVAASGAPVASTANAPAEGDRVARLRAAVRADELARKHHVQWKGEGTVPGDGAGGAGIPIRVEGAWESSGRGFVATEGPSGRMVLGFDGARAWQRFPDGRVRVLPPSEQKRARTELLRLLPGFPFAPGLPVVVRPLGDDPLGFRVEPEGGEPVDLRVDAASGLPRSASMAVGQPFEWREWTRVDGIPLPSVVAVAGAGGRTSLTRQSDFGFDGPVPAGFFERPARDFRFERPDRSAVVPFAGGGLFPVVDGTIGDRPVRLAVDLSSPRSILSEGVARELRADAKSGQSVAAAVRLPGVTLPKVEYLVAAPSYFLDLGARLDDRVDGLVGADQLLRFTGVFDVEHARLRLVDPDAVELPMAGNEQVLPLRETRGVPVFPVAAGGAGFFSVLDTTRDETFVVPVPVADEVGLVGGSPVKTLGAGARLARLGDFSLGDFRFTETVALVAPSADPAAARTARVGLGALGDGWFAWEPEKERARWKRGDREARAPLARSGMEVERRGGRFYLTAVVEAGPAARAGLRPGDRLVELDGRNLDDIGLAAVRSSLARAPGTRAGLVFERAGQSRKIGLTFGDLGQAARIQPKPSSSSAVPPAPPKKR